MCSQKNKNKINRNFRLAPFDYGPGHTFYFLILHYTFWSVIGFPIEYTYAVCLRLCASPHFCLSNVFVRPVQFIVNLAY